MEEEIPSGTKWEVCRARLPRPSETSPYRLRSGILNALPRWTAMSYSQVLTEPVSLPGLPCRFNKTFCPQDDSSGPTNAPCTPIVSTAMGSNWCASARAAYLRPCAPQRSLQLHQLPLLTYSDVPLQKYQHTCNPNPNSYHH